MATLRAPGPLQASTQERRVLTLAAAQKPENHDEGRCTDQGRQPTSQPGCEFIKTPVCYTPHTTQHQSLAHREPLLEKSYGSSQAGTGGVGLRNVTPGVQVRTGPRGLPMDCGFKPKNHKDHQGQYLILTKTKDFKHSILWKRHHQSLQL